MPDDRTGLIEAILLAEKLRAEHNGIGGVYLYLGHDGDNACTLKDIDAKELAKVCSGLSLLSAVQQAERKWKMGKFRNEFRVVGLATEAIGLYCGDRQTHGSGVFSTSAFREVAHKWSGLALDDAEADALILSEPRIVRLDQRITWFLLPGELKRCQGGIP